MSIPQFKNNRLLKTIRREPVDATPIWIMRQAGRYLPEYRATREKAGSFLALCKTPELACEVTLQPLRRFSLDAAIIFSDILTIPDAMGLGLQFAEGHGPFFSHPLHTPADIHQLHLPEHDALQYVYQAIALTNQALASSIPLIGFCGSPWTLAAYMVEGQAKTGFARFKALRTEQPLLLHKLLEILASAVSAHLIAQIEAGAALVMIFDTWGGMLPFAEYTGFSLSYMQQIIASIRAHYTDRSIPIILFTKGGKDSLEKMAASGCDVVGLDWEITLAEARSRVQDKVALQGNLHPELLRESPALIRQEVSRVLQSFGSGSGHIFNLGHGITPDILPDHVAVLVEAVHELSKPFHRHTQHEVSCNAS